VHIGMINIFDSNSRQAATVASSSLQRQKMVWSRLNSVPTSPPVQIPPRTKLYSLEPRGTDGGIVEGLTSYVMRLANEHSVTVGSLVSKVLAEAPNLQGRLLCPGNIAEGGDRHAFGSGSYSINGMTERSAGWVDSLIATTGRQDLRLLTLLPLASVIDERLFCKRRRWCSLCLHQWRQDTERVYEPLLWGITVASHCPIHCVELSSICHHCGSSMAPLATFSVPGRCFVCGVWLGKAAAEMGEQRGGSDSVRAAEQVASILAILPKIDPTVVLGSLRRNLNAYLEEVASGDIPAMARYLQCESISLRSWLSGASGFQFKILVRMATSLDVTAASFLAATLPSSENIERARKAVALLGPAIIQLSPQTNNIRKALLDALEEEIAPSPMEVARRLGLATEQRLGQVDPSLYRQVVKRYRKLSYARKDSREQKLVKEALERAIESDVPTGLEQIARDFGYTCSSSIRSWFPGLCAALRNKINKNAQALFAKMRLYLENTLSQDPPTSLRESCRHIGCDRQQALAHAADLCSRIVARHNDYLEERKASLRRGAEAAFAESPPPTLNKLCSRLSVDVEFMRKHFPSTMRQLVEQRRLYMKNEISRGKELLIINFPKIATDLQSQGIYPSLPRILERLPKGSRVDREFTGQLVIETHKKLGIPPSTVGRPRRY
jgi:hypothetical protein